MIEDSAGKLFEIFMSAVRFYYVEVFDVAFGLFCSNICSDVYDCKF